MKTRNLTRYGEHGWCWDQWREGMTMKTRNLKRYGEHGWCWDQWNEFTDTWDSYRTNKSGEGMFDYVTGKHDRQILGTCQFCLNAKTTLGIRRQIIAQTIR